MILQKKVRPFEDEEARPTDIKTQFLGPGVAALSKRAAILVREMGANRMRVQIDD